MANEQEEFRCFDQFHWMFSSYVLWLNWQKIAHVIIYVAMKRMSHILGLAQLTEGTDLCIQINLTI